MRVVRYDEVEWSGLDVAHRGGGVQLKTLLVGTEGTLENYWLSIGQSDGSYKSPRHRHNFDQFRMCLEGRTSIDPKKYMEIGEIGYFPEGAAYGPQQDTETNLTLLLQFGGMSGGGYLSRDQQRNAQSVLKSHGKFQRGVFQNRDETRKKNQDAFEAIWEHAMERKLIYPNPRYHSPIFIQPNNFSWKGTTAEGVLRKPLGQFTEREIRVEIFRLESNTQWVFGSAGAVSIIFVLQGAGRIGEENYERFTSVESSSEEGEIRSTSQTEIVRFVLPPIVSMQFRPAQASSAA